MMPSRHVLTRAVLACLLFCSAAFAGAQAYTKIVVIGDSLTDTGNDTTVSSTTPTSAVAPVPSPVTGYTNGRFTSGIDTIPAARNYFGVWLEQFAAMLPAKPTIVNSLAGGTNYAYGFATTGTGQTTFTYGPNMALSFQVNNMGAQLASYLATKPTIDNKTLFVVWGGANDLITATSQQDIIAAAQREAGIVQALITAGATDFIVPNLPPLGLVPRFNGSAATSVPATAAAAGFDQALAAYLGGIPAANPGKTLHIYQLDTYTLFNTVVAAPGNRGFTNVTAPSSAAYATANAAINPDNYLFWDDLHPTTHGHNIIALAAMTLLGTPIATTTTLTSSNPNANQNANVTLTATVTSATGTVPTGTLTFLDGSTALNTVTLTTTTNVATITYTTATLAPGTHSLTAVFTGVNGTQSSASSAVIEVVTAPSISSTFSAASVDIKSGGTGTATLTLTPVGGISGTATFACGPLPAHFTCSFNPASIAIPGTNAPVTTTVTIGTSGSASLEMMRPGASASRIVYAFALPAFGLVGFGAMRRRRKSLRGTFLMAAVFAIFGAGALGLTGCGSGNDVRKGSYPVSAIATLNGVTSTAVIQVNVQ